MNRFLESLKRFFEPLSTAQKALFGFLSVAIIGVLIGLLFWLSRPDYSLLFGNLSPKTAQGIVQELKDQGVSYELTNEGTSIMVPRSQVHDLRLQFASESTAMQDHSGYELFDSNTLGMTDFMQRVNMKRALEGELSRTINSMAQIEFSRVHLVLPDRSPFAETTVEPSASVIVTLKPSQQLTNPQIDGISSLVAGSVESLNKDRVVIIDQKGNKISNNQMLNSNVAMSNAQMKHRQSVEQYLMDKTQTMLDRVLGAGNSIVRVSTEHDFEQLERESNLIDPESRIVISEEKRTEQATNNQSEPVEQDEYTPPALRNQSVPVANSNNQSSVRIRNYEVNTTKQTYKKPIGTINRVSASVLLNYKRETYEMENGQDSIAYEPYTNAELDEIRDVVSASLGLAPNRGDVLNISQVRFDNTIEDYMQRQEQVYQEQIYYNQLIRWVLIALAVLGSLALLYAIMRRMFPNMQPPFFMQQQVERGEREEQKAFPRSEEGEEEEQEGMGEEPYEGELEETTDMYRRKLSPEAQRRLKMKSKMFEEIKNFAEFKSDETSSLLRSMMVGEEDQGRRRRPKGGVKS